MSGANLQTWMEAARPRTLPAALAPVFVGVAAAAAEGGFRPVVLSAVLVAAIAIQVGTNFINDWGDFQRGADTPERLGPTRAVSAGLVSPETMLRAGLAAFGLSAVLGVALIGVGGWPILWIGIASILSGIAYTAGPAPLAYVGLGDLFVFVFFGPVAVLGTEWLMLDATTEAAWISSVGVGALATAILVVNNIRDARGDEEAGKRTLVVRFGQPAGRTFFRVLLLIAGLVPPVLVLSGATGAWVMLAWLAAPAARAPLALVAREDAGSELNGALAGTAKLHLVYGVLLSVGLLL